LRQDRLHLWIGGGLFHHGHGVVAFAGEEERQDAPVAGERPVKTVEFRAGAAAAQGVDHQRQGDLIEPWVERLAGEFAGRDRRRSAVAYFRKRSPKRRGLSCRNQPALK
jgi:hypothetical protein